MAAKEFLVARIVQEARRRRVRLSEVEQKMLYFSESYPTLPNMEAISERFNVECDDEKYETKIAKLSRSAFRQDCKEFPDMRRRWREAIKILKREDHYILVMLDVPRSAGEVLRLTITAVGIRGLGFCAIALLSWVDHHFLPRIPYKIQLVAFGLLSAFLIFLRFHDRVRKNVTDLIDHIDKRTFRLSPLRRTVARLAESNCTERQFLEAIRALGYNEGSPKYEQCVKLWREFRG